MIYFLYTLQWYFSTKAYKFVLKHRKDQKALSETSVSQTQWMDAPVDAVLSDCSVVPVKVDGGVEADVRTAKEVQPYVFFFRCLRRTTENNT